MTRIAAIAIVAAACVGCATEEPGINPDKDRFYFPMGLALDPTGPFLFVANSNSDLRFNGGTIMVLDLTDLPTDPARYGSSKKLECQAARADSTSWECKESQLAHPSATIRIGHYPSGLQVSRDGSRLFTAVRGERSYLLWVDIARWTENNRARIDLRCHKEHCQAKTKGDCPEWDCDDAHAVSRSEALRKDLPREPFGILLNQMVAVHVDAAGNRLTCLDGRTRPTAPCGANNPCVVGQCQRSFGLCSAVPCTCSGTRCSETKTSGCCIDAASKDQVYMAHLSGGEVSLSTSTSSGVAVDDFRGGFFTASDGVGGGYDLAARVPGDASGRVYVSSRVDSVIGSFLVRDDKRIVDTTRAKVDAVYPATDVRGLAFAPGGGTLYLTNRAPAALVALDMTLEDGLPRHESLWAVEVCADPARVRLGRGPAGELLAYVVCFAASQIYVIDTSMAKVVDQIATGSGPYDLVLDPSSKRAFVTNFLERTVGVIDLDPTRASYHRMIARLGLAENLVKE